MLKIAVTAKKEEEKAQNIQCTRKLFWIKTIFFFLKTSNILSAKKIKPNYLGRLSGNLQNHIYLKKLGIHVK